jgi:RNA polymerase sigma-70 factor (ECF subfamily)
MISTQARGIWQELETKLRPYIARRVPHDIDPNDVLQDVFVRLHRGQDSLRDEDSFGGWVYRIARHSIADHLRKHDRSPPLSAQQEAQGAQGAQEATASDAVHTHPAEDEDLTPELAQCVAIFVARLPSPYREAVLLTELNGLTHKAAAEVLSVPISTLKSRVARGRRRIRDMFDECCIIAVDSRGRVIRCDARELEQIPADCRDMAQQWSEKQRSRQP